MSHELGSIGDVLSGSERSACSESSDEQIARPELTQSVRAALSTLSEQPERRADGTFVTASIKTGERSQQFWRAVEPAKRELVERLSRDQALDGDAAETLGGLIDAYAEARIFRTSMFVRLVEQGGPITTKGKARALYKAYLSALDRETKLAQILGLVRKRRPVNPLDAVRDAVAEANKR